ncbi:hypothetical protein MC885_016676, partial [Smutsia gigantea]
RSEVRTLQWHFCLRPCTDLCLNYLTGPDSSFVAREEHRIRFSRLTLPEKEAQRKRKERGIRNDSFPDLWKIHFLKVAERSFQPTCEFSEDLRKTWSIVHLFYFENLRKMTTLSISLLLVNVSKCHYFVEMQNGFSHFVTFL